MVWSEIQVATFKKVIYFSCTIHCDLVLFDTSRFKILISMNKKGSEINSFQLNCNNFKLLIFLQSPNPFEVQQA